MGWPIHNLNPNKIVSLGISQVPEGRRIFPYLYVMKNLDSEGHIWGFNPKSRSSLAFKFSLSSKGSPSSILSSLNPMISSM
jgi:branched-chain amino acid transport system ATP-binding protein